MILITGGLGFIGGQVARALVDAGESCIIASRAASDVPEFLAHDLGGSLFVEPLDTVDAHQWHTL